MRISPKVKGYHLKCPDTTKIIISKDVSFDEQFMLENKTKEKVDDILK